MYPRKNKEEKLNKCLLLLIKMLFLPENTLYFVSEGVHDLSILPNIELPRIVIRTDTTINTTIKSYNNYVIFGEEYENLTTILQTIKGSNVWDESESPRGRFLVVTSTNNLRKTFELFWKYHILNVVFVQCSEEYLYVYTSNPFTENSACASKSDAIFKQTCSESTSIIFDKPISKLTGCPIKLISRAPLSRDPYITGGGGVFINVLYMIGEILQTNVSVLITDTDLKRVVYRNEGDLRILLEVSRAPKLYEHYDLSDIVYQDEIVWIVPSPAKIGNVRIILYVFDKSVWASIIVVFVITVVTMRFFAKYREPLVLKDFSITVLIVLAYTLDNALNFTPETNMVRLTWMVYFIYHLLVSTAFHGKLISTLTNPRYERPMNDLEDLAKSSIPVVVQAVVDEYTYGPEYGETWSQIQKKFIIQDVMNIPQTLYRIAYYRNCSAPLTRGDVNIVHVNLRPYLVILDQNKGYIDAQAIVGIRKGHYFMKTLNTISNRITESGFHKKILSDAIRPMFVVDSENADTVLTMTHLGGVFVWWIYGVSISVGIFLLEKLWVDYIKPRKLRGNNQSRK